ncbi:MAG: transposase [Bacteroidales bacterium]
MPWAEIEILYNSKLGNNKRGAGNKPARMIIGALIIKHKMNLSDEETIYTIQENPYMQYFLGLSEFTDKPIFNSSLFVTIRKRLGTDDFNEMSLTLLLTQLEKAKSANQSDKDEKDKKDKNNTPNSSSANQVSENESQFTDSQGRKHQGSLKIDATCADAEVRYPTDIDLLHDSSRVINRLMSKLCKNFSLQQPNSHYKQARKSYLEVIKRKKKSKKLINNGKLELLAYLGRDIHSFVTLIATNGTQLLYKLRSDEQRLVGSIIKVFSSTESNV